MTNIEVLELETEFYGSGKDSSQRLKLFGLLCDVAIRPFRTRFKQVAEFFLFDFDPSGIAKYEECRGQSYDVKQLAFCIQRVRVQQLAFVTIINQ